ncbi:oxidoreductase [Sphingobium yanoikuyae]|uniref:oxidoreductase n=1 Tax=Sphingobium yanoikuyae TaxID=13690 RepID=UPI00242C9445|nr:oxidoreductase [Sphingobium yanoikuyae]
MSALDTAGTYRLGDRTVRRIGYGAMQLAGPNAFGPPRDRSAALGGLRAAIASGVDHIDTSDYYGPHITNELIREALHPYPADLMLVTKVGAKRGVDGSWNPAASADELRGAVHHNLRRLGLETLELVNFRLMLDESLPAEGSVEEPLAVLDALRQEGLIRNIGISNATPAQVREARRLIEIACVQNKFNLAHRGDEALIAELAADGIAYVPFYPLSGFSDQQTAVLDEIAAGLGATPMQVALAWLLQHSPNILLIPGTSSIAHLKQNLAVAGFVLPAEAVALLDGIATG